MRSQIQPLLLPASPRFVWGTLIVALLLDLLPFGRVLWLPDFLALALVFWGLHQPRRVGMVTAFLFGLALDVHQASLLGQHALAYTLLVYSVIALRRRILWLSVWSQSIQMLPLFFMAHGVVLVLRLISGAPFPGWMIFVQPVFEAALWPLAGVILLAPQRRAPHPDADRPL